MMPVSVVTAPSFLVAAKRLFKKYKPLKVELAALEEQLLAKPDLGTSLGNNAYKIRLAIRSKQQGKSGGARVITYLETVVVADAETQTVNLIYIYDLGATMGRRQVQQLWFYKNPFKKQVPSNPNGV